MAQNVTLYNLLISCPGGRSVTANTFFAGFTSPVDIDEDEKEFITAVAEQLESELSDSFFALGNLNQDTLGSNVQ